MDRYIGRLLDNRYEILEVIGTGGMAVVYKARCHRLNRLVAIKILKDEYSQDEEFRRRFHAESQAVAMLSHANIVQVYDVSTTGEADYIVMELIDGITLKQYMEKMGTLNWKETLHFGIQIAKALEHAHSRGIVHRDIKPHNIMVLKNGSVKVADFGIAQVMSKTSTLTKEALGSVHYISPEQAKGGRVDNRSDIYSLGVVMYEMITGRPPYDGDTPVAVAIKHINGGAVPPSIWNPNLPAGLEQIIMKAMAHELSNRYETATQMLQQMEAFRQEPSLVFAPVKSELLETRRAAATTAEKKAAAVSKNPRQPERKRQSPSQNDRRREAKRREENQSRIATIAIVACSLVAVLAIVIFLVTLTNGGQIENPQTMVEVPVFVGKYYDNLPDYPGITVVLDKEVYDDSYMKDQIITQNPSSGDMVVQGTKVYVTVSMGPEPLIKTMDNLINVDIAQARSFLDGQGLNLHIIEREENSEEIEPGKITRTDPEEGAELSEGQTISVWISIGPAVKMVRMPNVVGQNVNKAIDVLHDNGLDNVETELVDSYDREGTVVWQSVNRYESVDVTTTIVLHVSKGLTAPTEEPTTEPTTEPTSAPTAPSTEPPAGMATREVVFHLPESTENYVFSIRQNGTSVIPDVQVMAGARSITITLTASGVQQYDLFINDVFFDTQEVEFVANG